MTPIDSIVKRARELLAEATTSPWEHRDGIIDEEAPGWEGVYDWDGHNVEDDSANCRFVAFARNNLGALLDEVERLDKAQANSTDRDYALMAEERDAMSALALKASAAADAAEARVKELEMRVEMSDASREVWMNLSDERYERVATLEAALREARDLAANIQCPPAVACNSPLCDQARRVEATIDAALAAGTEET